MGLFQLQVPGSRTQSEQIFEQAGQQRQDQQFMQVSKPAFALATTQQFRQVFANEPSVIQSNLQRNRQDTIVTMGVISGQKQQQFITQAMAVRSIPKFETSQQSRSRQSYITDEMQRTAREPVTTIVPKFDITQSPRRDAATRITTDIVPALKITTEIIETPPIPPIIPGIGLPGGGGGSSYGQQPSERLWTFTNPVGADRLTREAGRKFKPMNMKIKKFKMPRF
jgi:hypothetical protein